MSLSGPWADPIAPAPLFPLPNVVLFPRAVLPLHIFEPRYREMVADALLADRRIAMALLCAGWEKDYYGPAAIEPIVCTGRIVSHERLADGRYNLLLQGETRARVISEQRDRPYRLAELAPLQLTNHLEIDLATERQKLVGLFAAGPWRRSSAGRQFRNILQGSLPTADVADLMAFTLISDVPLKQSLLAECDVRERVRRTISAVVGLPVVQDETGDVSMN